MDVKTNFSFNKEETEERMEKLMNRIVAKPNLIADDQLNAKIENIFNVEVFQKMVENADIFQDLSSSSIFNQSEMLQKSMNNPNLSFKKVLPTHSQLQEEDDEPLPKFGHEDHGVHNDINDSVNELFAPSSQVRTKNADKKKGFQANDDSFSNKHGGTNKDLNLDMSQS